MIDLRAAFLAAVLGLASILPAAAQTPDAERARIEGIVRDYLLNNPEMLREMAQRLSAKEKVAEDKARVGAFSEYRDTIYNSKRQVVIGNPKGDVTLVEFFDYNCGYCRRAMSDTDALLKSDPKLRIVLKEMPVLGEGSHDAARVAVAVNAQAPEKYLEFHRQMLGSDEQASGQTALAVAKKLGLDMDKLAEALADPEVDATLLEVHQLAQKLNIEGTPTYVIADQIVPGAVGVATLREIIGNVRSCGKATCS